MAAGSHWTLAQPWGGGECRECRAHARACLRALLLLHRPPRLALPPRLPQPRLWEGPGRRQPRGWWSSGASRGRVRPRGAFRGAAWRRFPRRPGTRLSRLAVPAALCVLPAGCVTDSAAHSSAVHWPQGPNAAPHTTPPPRALAPLPTWVSPIFADVGGHTRGDTATPRAQTTSPPL